MLYRKFGKTGVEVSALGFGAMRLPIIGGKFDNIDEKTTEAMLAYAVEHGVNYVDTAYVYHGGMSEKVVGKILKKGLRKKINLATKLPTWMITQRKDMDKYLDEQLERLQTDHIDFYLVHGLGKDRWSAMEEFGVIDFIESAKKDGRIIHAGFSYHDEPQNFKSIVDAYNWDFCQIQFNFMDTAYQAGLKGLRYVGSKGMGLAIMEPLKGGQLTGTIPPSVQKIWDKAKVKRTPAEWGLRYVWNYKEPGVVLSGMSTLEQVKENVRLADGAKPDSMTAEEKALIDKVKKAYKAMVAVDCTNCKYCMPCPSGVDIPGNFSMLNNATMFKSSNTMKMVYQMYMPENERASNCAKCGECEEKCPQHLPIKEKLEEVVKVLS
jgi:uncharacterized protein